jgi:hypothetical protein
VSREYTIQKYPTGLPGLLAMKASGNVPPELLSQVQASVDITEFYLALEFRVASGNTAGVATTGFAGVSGTLTVPDGEMWCMRRQNAVVTSGLPAGTTYQFRTALLRRGFGTVTNVQVGERASSGTVGAQPAASQIYTPWVLAFPGDTFGVWVESLALGVAQPFAISVEYSRITI